MLLLAVVGCSVGGRAHRTQELRGDLSALDTAVRSVSADRGFVLSSVDAVQTGAAALDRTDAVCAGGDGVAARTSHRLSLPLSQKAREALAALPRRIADYQSALRSLAAASSLVSGAPRDALTEVVHGGEAEAAAVLVFRTSVAKAWPQYDLLDGNEGTWITRAVTPWYRTHAEAAAAYAVLVSPSRPALERARVSLGAAADAVRVPSMAQSATLAAADKALQGLRAPA